jgi:hypothetical protein
MFEWTEMNEFVLQNLPGPGKAPFWMRGETTLGKMVYGVHVQTCEGIGFFVRYGSKKFLIVNKFAYSLTCPPRPSMESLEDAEEGLEKVEKVQINTDTIHFWLSSGVSTKTCITQDEMRNGYLMYPMSKAGLEQHTMPLPVLSPHLYQSVHITDDDIQQCNYTNFFLHTGRLLTEPSGDMAPKPFHSYIEAALKEMKNEWHLERAEDARLNGNEKKCIISKCGNHISYYDFDDHNHLLRVQEFSPNKFNTWTIKLPTHPPSHPGSPGSPFVLRDVPEFPDDMLDITGIGALEEASYSEKIALMTEEELIAEREKVLTEFIAIGEKFADVTLEESKRKKRKDLS